MKVLQIHTRYREAGGEDAVVADEAQLLRDAGHEVTQLQATNPRSAPRAALALATAPWNPRAAARVSRVATTSRPDVAHVHNTWLALSPAVITALRSAGIPVIFTLHNYRLMCVNALLLRNGRPCEDCVGRSPWPGIRHRCYRGSAAMSAVAALTTTTSRKVWDDVTVFIAFTDFAKGRFLAAGLPEGRVAVKPHAVVDPGPRRCPPSRSETVLFVGRLAPEKGIEVLLDAWQRAELQDLELVILGEGPERARLADRRVRGAQWCGWVDPAEVARRMLEARALVFPSLWYETFGLALVQGMAAGLPVLASDLGGTAEILGEEGSRGLVPAGDAAAWSAALRRVARDPDIDQWGLAARRRYERHYTPAQSLAALEAIYERARAA